MRIQNVLVVDDDEVSNILVSSLMEDVFRNCSVTIKQDGEQALSYLKLVSVESAPFPDLIVLDFNQPYMGATDFVKVYEANFSAIFPATQIIILTCHALEKNRQALLAFPSVAAFFHKPLGEAQLIQIGKQQVNYA